MWGGWGNPSCLSVLVFVWFMSATRYHFYFVKFIGSNVNSKLTITMQLRCVKKVSQFLTITLSTTLSSVSNTKVICKAAHVTLIWSHSNRSLITVVIRELHQRKVKLHHYLIDFQYHWANLALNNILQKDGKRVRKTYNNNSLWPMLCLLLLLLHSSVLFESKAVAARTLF